eukprot:Nk52_evm45s1810 gene=Nk52_evmTU45s1810
MPDQTSRDGLLIKASFGEDLRRFNILANELNYEKLREKIVELFGFHRSDFLVKYSDEDGDMVTVTCDEELQNLVERLRTSGILRFSISFKTILLIDPGTSHNGAKTKAGKQDITDPGIESESSPSAGEGTNREDFSMDGAVRLLNYGYDHGTIIQMLRDISLYICAREGLQNPEVTQEVTKKKSLITKVNYGPANNVGIKAESKDKRPATEERASDKGTVPVSAWDESFVIEWMDKVPSLREYCTLFKENDINGEMLLELDHEALKSMGVVSAGKRMKILKEISSRLEKATQ